MKYKVLGKTGMKVSRLGMGTMRFPLLTGSDTQLNEELTIELIRYALENGVNYIDTAYTYHNGASEVVVGKAIRNKKRNDFFLTSKCPVWEIQEADDFDRILDIQLKRLGADYLDCYLFHAIGQRRWEIIKELKLLDKIERAKSHGIIKHIGFSFHDEYNIFEKIVKEYDNWELCQLQYNYVDTNKQAGTKGIKLAKENGLGVIVMEPLHGGRLVNPPKQVKRILSNEKTPVEWALDYLWNQEEVDAVLSGMSEIKQIEENISYVDRAYVSMLSESERDMFIEAKKKYDSMSIVPCTNCGYCMPCPYKLNIPELMRVYNRTGSTNYRNARLEYENILIKADECRHCHVCEERCPQDIIISKEMDAMNKVFSKEPPPLDMEALRIKWPERYEKMRERGDIK